MNLGGNQLTNIPEEISQLRNLHVLSFGSQPWSEHKNAIKEVPAEISQLQDLIALDLRWNKIQVLPKTVFSMKNLRELDLRNNPVTELYVQELKKKMPWCNITF